MGSLDWLSSPGPTLQQLPVSSPITTPTKGPDAACFIVCVPIPTQEPQQAWTKAGTATTTAPAHTRCSRKASVRLKEGQDRQINPLSKDCLNVHTSLEITLTSCISSPAMVLCSRLWYKRFTNNINPVNIVTTLFTDKKTEAQRG